MLKYATICSAIRLSKPVNISLENGKIDIFYISACENNLYLTLHFNICIFNHHWKVRAKKKEKRNYIKKKYKTSSKGKKPTTLNPCCMTLQKKNTKQQCVLKRNLLRQIQLFFKQTFKVHLQYKILMALETWEGMKSFSFFLQNCKVTFSIISC